MKRQELAAQAAKFVVTSDLPETARDLVGLLGWERARSLISEWGGIPFPVPKSANGNPAGAQRYKQLVETVGEEGADLIIWRYGDEVLTVPNCKWAIARATNRAMVAFYDTGATLEDCARAFGLTTRWVSIVLKRTQPMPREEVLMLTDSHSVPEDRHG